MDDALFASTEGKGDQSAAMSEVSREVKEALTLEDEEVPVEGRYSENDVGVSGNPFRVFFVFQSQSIAE